MKFGIRKPSLKKSLKARTIGKYKRAVKKALIPGYGKKGMGWIKNPKKAAYNKVYRVTTVSIFSDGTKHTLRKKASDNDGCRKSANNHANTSILQKEGDINVMRTEATQGAENKKAKSHIWLWILGWIFIFPLPLTIILVRNQRMNRFVKIFIIVVTWIVYLGVAVAVASDEPNEAKPSFDGTDSQTSVENQSNQQDVVSDIVQVEAITLQEYSTDLVLWETTTAVASITPSNAVNKTLVWKSSDENVAKVDEKGNVIAVGGGNATITATSDNGVASSFVVSVDGTKAIMRLSTRRVRNDSENIGNEWSYQYQINGAQVDNSMILSVGDKLSLSAVITEADNNPDVGSNSISHTVTKDDLTNGFEEQFEVVVTENGGRNSGKSARFNVYYSFSPSK